MNFNFDSPRKALQDNVVWLLNKYEWSFDELARQTDGLLSVSLIASMSSGKSFCSSKSLSILGKAFGVEPYQLLNPNLSEVYDEIKINND